MKPLTRHRLITTLKAALITTFLAVTGAESRPTPHETLRLENRFERPEEVLGYYCARDASGFVWSGLLDQERKQFTTWADAPRSEGFFVAENYEINALKRSPSSDRAEFEVIYFLKEMQDPSGTKISVQETTRHVRYVLKREKNQWKIVEPAASEISPVILKSKVAFLP